MEEEDKQTRPNILFIFADDWGWGDLGCYGHPVAKTPYLDALADQGTIFTQFYVASGVCSPSRAAALTGQCPARLGIHGHFTDHDINARRGMPNWLDPAVPNYMRTLQQAGYRIGHFGKWHLGHGPGAPEPFAYGVDECRINDGNGPQLEFNHENFTPETRCRSSEFIVNHTIRFLEESKENSFAINVWLNDTHAILAPSEEQLRPYEQLRPQFVGDRHCGAPAIYYSVITEADRQIGRLLATLDRLGLADNTIVIFSADNGPEDILSSTNASHSGVGSPGPFRGRKRSSYEGGIRVPFILRWPAGGVKQGAVDDRTPLSALDLFPAFCALADVPLPEGHLLDGEDMSDVFHGMQRDRRTPLLWEWRFGILGHPINKSPILAIRRNQWKLLLNPDLSRVELYDIPADPMELSNLAKQYPETVEELSEKAIHWQNTLPDGPVRDGAGSNDYPWPKARVSGQQGAECDG